METTYGQNVVRGEKMTNIMYANSGSVIQHFGHLSCAEGGSDNVDQIKLRMKISFVIQTDTFSKLDK